MHAWNACMESNEWMDMYGLVMQRPSHRPRSLTSTPVRLHNNRIWKTCRAEVALGAWIPATCSRRCLVVVAVSAAMATATAMAASASDRAGAPASSGTHRPAMFHRPAEQLPSYRQRNTMFEMQCDRYNDSQPRTTSRGMTVRAAYGTCAPRLYTMPPTGSHTNWQPHHRQRHYWGIPGALPAAGCGAGRVPQQGVCCRAATVMSRCL